MKSYRVVHITDLHLDSLTGQNENLRVANYKPFLNNLIREIKKQALNQPIDYLICTGDFVHQGNTGNFNHCSNILKYFAEGLGIDFSKVLLCLGNHDFEKSKDTENPIKAREEYYEFASEFNRNKEKYREDLFQIYHDEALDVFITLFDSTFGSNGKNTPTTLTKEKIDEIYLSIETHVPSDKPLFVLSHFPMDQPGKPDLLMEETNWPEKHIWKDGYQILFKLNSLRDQGLTLYFHGDGHSPDFWSYSKYHHAFMTGMIGGNHQPEYKNKTGESIFYNKITEAKLISIDESFDCDILTFQFKNDGFNFSTNTGSWIVHPSKPRYKSNKSKSNLVEQNKIITKERFYKDIKTQLISGSIEDAIFEEISNNKLYSFGQHKTSSLYSSLGWVDIDSLMNNRSIFSRCVEKLREWIKSIDEKRINSTNSIFIGLDFWGSCIAAQSSVLTGIPNQCVATKLKGKYNIDEVKLGGLIGNKDIHYEYIILVSDVVSTGHSVNQVAEMIVRQLGENQAKIISVSIISDTNQAKSVELVAFYKMATFCSKLRIPVLKNDLLPGIDIITPRLDIS